VDVSRVPAEVLAVARQIEQAGGTTRLVGGAVCDLLVGREPKDYDIEVHGMGYSELEPVLAEYGAKQVGKCFGIIPLRVEGVEIDVNIPKADNLPDGQDFDPTMSVEEAGRRRDFSFNSMAVDLVTGELTDKWGGQRDLEKGILRATDPELFVQDANRAFRAMQFLGREKAESVDPHTRSLIVGMIDEFDQIAPERVKGEWDKLLLKGRRPSKGLEFLLGTGWLRHFPELDALVDCMQNEEYHPEGTVWTHTLYAADAAAYVRHNLPEDWRTAFVYGVMLHDVGKPATTVTQQMLDERHPWVVLQAERMGKLPKLLSANAHDVQGAPLARQFMERLTNEKALLTRVPLIVEKHMQPWALYSGRAPAGKLKTDPKKPMYKRLHRRIRLDVIGWMSRCDHCGTGHGRSQMCNEPDLDHETSQACFDYFGEFGPAEIPKIVTGKVLIKEGGVKPPRGSEDGQRFGRAIEAAYQAQLDNEEMTKDDLLKVALATFT
jgi:tRNA nucleotidyltransferase (CCA-adding enzyme)